MEAKKSAFNFIDFKIKSFSLSDIKEENLDLAIRFIPNGIFNNSTKEFKVMFKLDISFDGETKIEFIQAQVESLFKFNNETQKENIPTYFFGNSIAIVFPYIRAFISTITAVANLNPLMLPLLNLSSLTDDLKENTEYID
jgi:preprotein translocase subunit SecB